MNIIPVQNIQEASKLLEVIVDNMLPETDIFEIVKYYLKRAHRANSNKIVIPENIFNKCTTGPRLYLRDNLSEWVKEEGGILLSAFEGFVKSDLTIMVKWD